MSMSKCECCGQELPRIKTLLEEKCNIIYLDIWDETGSMYEGIKASLDFFMKHKDDKEWNKPAY